VEIFGDGHHFGWSSGFFKKELFVGTKTKQQKVITRSLHMDGGVFYFDYQTIENANIRSIGSNLMDIFFNKRETVVERVIFIDTIMCPLSFSKFSQKYSCIAICRLAHLLRMQNSGCDGFLSTNPDVYNFVKVSQNGICHIVRASWYKKRGNNFWSLTLMSRDCKFQLPKGTRIVY
jgi:hypothetical protein